MLFILTGMKMPLLFSVCNGNHHIIFNLAGFNANILAFRHLLRESVTPCSLASTWFAPAQDWCIQTYQLCWEWSYWLSIVNIVFFTYIVPVLSVLINWISRLEKICKSSLEFIDVAMPCIEEELKNS